MTNERLAALFGGPPRDPESAIEQRHMDLAASIQAVTEQAMLAMGRELFRETGLSRLVLAGGVALNCVANGRLLREGLFEDIWMKHSAGSRSSPRRRARTCCSSHRCKGRIAFP